MGLSQPELIHAYNDKFRPKFNRELFVRHDDDIINSLKNVILSCERDSTFTIKVVGFEVIDNYDDVNHILWAYEDSMINKNSKSQDDDTVKKRTSSSKKKDNQFEFINLKPSAIKIIKVTYFISIVEKKNGLVSDNVVVYIAIPRIVDKFYFKINGNIVSEEVYKSEKSKYDNLLLYNYIILIENFTH